PARSPPYLHSFPTRRSSDLDPKRALVAALRARPQTMDVGEIDGRLFVNIAGLGLDAYVASQFNASGASRRRLAGYVGCTARALLDRKSTRLNSSHGSISYAV